MSKLNFMQKIKSKMTSKKSNVTSTKMSSNSSVAKRLILGFSVILILASITLGLSYLNISKFEKYNKLNLHSYSVLDELDNILVAMLNMETGERGFVLTGNKDSLEPYTTGKDLIYKSINNAKNLTIDDEEQQNGLIQIENLVGEWIAIANKMVENKKLVSTGYYSMEDLIEEEKSGKGNALVSSLRSVLQELETIEYKKLDERGASSTRMMTTTKVAIILGTAAMISMAAVISFLTITSITKPINEIVRALGIVASGDFSVKISSSLLAKRDEMGKLAFALEKMVSDLRELISKVTVISGDVRQSAETVELVSSEAKNSAEEVTKSIEEVAIDIQKQVDASNHIITRTENLTVNISDSNLIIEEAIDSSDKANQLSIKGQHIMSELNKKTHQNSVKSTEVNEAILEVSKYANNAQSIISIIQSISSQTNLLALNASIEAARAGDAGRGFAVVANEIRKLAEDTLKATVSINELIDNIQSKSDNAVSIVSEVIEIVENQNESILETTDIFTETATVIDDLVSKINQVKSYSLHISDSKDEIMSTVEVITSLSEDNSAATEEIAASSEEQLAAMEEMHSLSQTSKILADKLSELVHVFKV